LYQAALVRIGHHLVELVLEDELPDSWVKLLVKHEIYPFYSKYIYKSKNIHTFVTYATPFVFSAPAPDIVGAVVPVSVYGLYIGEFLNFRFLTHTTYLSTKPLSRFAIAWRYEKPKLFVGYQGEVEIRAHWRVQFDEVNNVLEVENDTRDILVDLIAGHVMTSLGRSRRMVRIGDSNMEFDAAEMVAEGEELIREARGRLIALADITASSF
jgi:hypothetical protein